MPVQKPTGMHRKARLRETHTTSMHAAPSGILNRSGEVTVVEGPAGLVPEVRFLFASGEFQLANTPRRSREKGQQGSLLGVQLKDSVN